MQVVAADVGNSSTKLIETTWTEMSGEYASDARSIQSVSRVERGLATPLNVSEQAAWFVSSVNQSNLLRLREWAQQSATPASWNLIERSGIPLHVDLDQPDSVGVDRLLAAYAAHRKYGQDRETIVIDCGTALTIDLVDRQAHFRGGLIMSGPATNLQALSQMTSALPDLSTEKLLAPKRILGRSTKEAMLNGAWLAGLGAIQYAVQSIAGSLPEEPAVVGTGGGLGPWRDRLPADWILVEDLVLDGILQLASHQLQ